MYENMGLIWETVVLNGILFGAYAFASQRNVARGTRSTRRSGARNAQGVDRREEGKKEIKAQEGGKDGDEDEGGRDSGDERGGVRGRGPSRPEGVPVQH